MSHPPPSPSVPPLPPDRSHLDTERPHPGTRDLHRLSARECVRLITREDERVHEAMRRAEGQIAALVEAAEPGFVAGGRLVYVGCGTSGRLGVLDASEAPPTFHVDPGRVVGIIAGGDAALRRSSEGAEDDAAGAVPELDRLELGARDTVIGIAAGGTTPFVLGALAHVGGGASPPLTALITCARVAPPRGVAHLVALDTGPEVLTGSTRMKAGTATKLALNTISTTLMIRAGRVHGNLMVDVRATNDKLRDRALRIIAELTGLDRAASLALLERAGGGVKLAIAMAWLNVGPADAEARLASVGGRLGSLEDSRP